MRATRAALLLAAIALADPAAGQTPPTQAPTPAAPTTTLAPASVPTPVATPAPPAAHEERSPDETAIPQPGDAAPRNDAPLRIAVVEAPPFAYRDSDGTWTGLSVVLWRVIAGHIERKWDWVPADTQAAFAQLESGSVDAIVGGVSITAERAKVVDFSAAFLSGELGVTVARGSALGVLTAARRIFTRHLLTILLGLGSSIVLAGTLMWAFERRTNAAHFGGRVHEGIGAGIWWAAVTMTTVGYGDTLPRTRGGRAIALVWMFISIVVISLFTASIVSMVTLASIRSRIESVEDLRRLRVAAVTGGTGQDFLRHHAIPTTTFANIDLALEAVADGRADAVVGQVPVMRWIVRRQWADQLVVTAPFLEQEFYAIALPRDSSLRYALNDALLRITETDDWRAVRERYLGH